MDASTKNILKENLTNETISYFQKLNINYKDIFRTLLLQNYDRFLENLSNDKDICQAYDMKVCQIFANHFYDIFNNKNFIEECIEKYDIYFLFMHIFNYFHKSDEILKIFPFAKSLW